MHGDELLFGRFTREECGLPPPGKPPFAERMGKSAALALLAALTVAGWVAGDMVANWRESRVARLPAELSAAEPGEHRRLLASGRIFAAARPENAGMRRNLALAVMTAAESAPRRAGYFGSAAALLAGGSAGPDASPSTAFAAFAGELSAAALHEELGDHREAFAAVDRAAEALDRVPDGALRRGLRLHLANTHAYLLASAPAGDGGDPGKALALADMVVASRDVLPGGGFASDQAAFLDTLAMARHRNGLSAEAVRTQRLALGMADAAGLDVYLRNFDLFRKGRGDAGDAREKPGGP